MLLAQDSGVLLSWGMVGESLADVFPNFHNLEICFVSQLGFSQRSFKLCPKMLEIFDENDSRRTPL